MDLLAVNVKNVLSKNVRNAKKKKGQNAFITHLHMKDTSANPVINFGVRWRKP